MKKLGSGIVTPVLRYWGLDEHPFDDSILREDGLKLFVDREEELHTLHNGLSGRLCGVYGSQGVGKSSFLRKFESSMRGTGTSIIYVPLMGTSETALLRSILAALLRAVMDDSIEVSRRLCLKPGDLLDRIEHSIRTSTESQFGASGLSPVNANLRKSHEKQAEPHTEESARQFICQIVQNTRTPFVVVVDDLERMKHFLKDEDAYFRFLTSFARTIDESFSSRMVSFVLSLDGSFVKKLNQNMSEDRGAVSFSFGELIELPTFRPEVLAEVMRTRLRIHGWKGKLRDFISEEAFLLLLAAAGGHPRRTLAVLRSAMESVEVRARRRFIDAESIIAALRRRNEVVHAKDAEIVGYLQKHKSISASDEKALSTLGIPRTTLRDRLDALSVKLYLAVSAEPSGKTVRHVYALPQDLLD